MTKPKSAANFAVPAQRRQVESEVKRSKFITSVERVESREQAEEFIRKQRIEHPQANHVCWAYIIGGPQSTIRSMSDDGEPSGTAGMPMLRVLAHSGFGDVVVTVVRYFGGTKLGTGGLQRAYSDAIVQVLTDLPQLQKIFREPMTVTYDYHFDAVIQQRLREFDVETVASDYGQQITLKLLVAETDAETLVQTLVNSTANQAKIVS